MIVPWFYIFNFSLFLLYIFFSISASFFKIFGSIFQIKVYYSWLFLCILYHKNNLDLILQFLFLIKWFFIKNIKLIFRILLFTLQLIYLFEINLILFHREAMLQRALIYQRYYQIKYIVIILSFYNFICT